jgi:hypothetical protein
VGDRHLNFHEGRDMLAVFEAWLLGGPADGRVMAIETTFDGQLPDEVRLPQSAVYVGSSDVPAPAVEHLYVRAEDIAGWVTYQYHQTSEPLSR